MGDILKFLTILLLIAIVLVFLIPIGWLVIKLFVWLFGGLVIVGAEIFWIIFIIVCIILLIKMLFD